MEPPETMALARRYADRNGAAFCEAFPKPVDCAPPHGKVTQSQRTSM